MIIYLELILQAGLLIAAIFGFVVGFRNKEGIKVFIGLISAILSFLMGILVIKLPAPQITRLEDYSAIKIYTDKGVPIQYKIRVFLIQKIELCRIPAYAYPLLTAWFFPCEIPFPQAPYSSVLSASSSLWERCILSTVGGKPLC